MTRRIFPVLAALLAAACVAPRPVQPPPDPRNIPAVAPLFLEGLIGRGKVGGVTLRAYNTGGIRTRGGAVSSLKSWSAKVRLDVPAFLIDHPREGLILFDTGLSSWTARRMNRWYMSPALRFESRPGQDILSQLRSDGVDPASVRWVILSHLHLDHSGLLDAFPNATVAASRREWEELKASQASKPDPSAFDPGAYESGLVPISSDTTEAAIAEPIGISSASGLVRGEPSPGPRLRLLDFDGAGPFGAFDRALDLFKDGTIFIVDLPGHTSGSIGAWVNLDGGPALLAGDAAWVVDNYMDLALPARQGIADLAAYWRSLHALRAMQQAIPRLILLPGHDLTPRTLTNREDVPLVPFPPRSVSGEPGRGS